MFRPRIQQNCSGAGSATATASRRLGVVRPTARGPAYPQKGDTDAGGKPERWDMVIETAWATLHGSRDDISGKKVDGDTRKEVTGKDVDDIDPNDLSDEREVARLREELERRKR